MALSLGRITVLSALGEPLRAEIDVPDINAEEAASLKAAIAGPDAFTAAGLEYNPAMSGVQTSLQRRADGRAFIRLSSERPINEPFVDMILETSWSSGRIVRDYTMLFDPPVTRKATPAPTLAQTAPAATPPASATQATSTAAPAASPAVESARPAKPGKPAKSTPVTAARAADKVPAEKPKSEAPAAPTDGADRITVKTGDTASKIAARIKPAGVSLDQMLVALLRANPDAFVKENINRVRTGAVMSVPSAEQAQSVPAKEASQTVLAHSKDFNEFRRNLAANAPVTAVDAAARKASGSVEAKVDDKKPASTTPDKLTLSKGAIQSKANEEKIAKERAQKEASARAAEIAKNTAELEKIRTASAAAAATKAPTASAAPAPAPVGPAVAVATTPAPVITPVVAASEPMPAASAIPAEAISAPADTASAPEAVASEPVTNTDTPPAIALSEPSLMDDLMDNLWLPAGAAGLLAILGGFAFWRVRQRKKNTSQMDSSFLESRLQPDSFFGASGGQRVDTNSEGNSAGSSMVYSASQLDAADDVDPVAEADVYLAYGRDLQAEEILKEAARTNPGRLAIHTKLLEIFAKRRDAKSYETTAVQAFKLTGEGNPDWARICNVGLDLDPNNPLYQPGGAPAHGDGHSNDSASSSFGNSTIPVMPPASFAPASSGTDLDLDLDFSLDEEPASAISDVTGGTFAPAAAVEPVVEASADPHGALDMDFDLSEEVAAPAPLEPAAVADAADAPLSMDGVSLTLDEPMPAPSFDATSPAPAFAATNTLSIEAGAPSPAASDMGMMEFDISSLSLDLDTPPAAEKPAEAPAMATADPLETKLALAEEFVSIGDDDGARALIEEVIAEATGEVRAKAQRALANLS
ncbi:MAG: fimbrial protein FimV [Burkholderiales bacterium]|nr:fimbrial protein FimV [Burkholderiales bacterium]